MKEYRKFEIEKNGMKVVYDESEERPLILTITRPEYMPKMIWITTKEARELIAVLTETLDEVFNDSPKN